MPAITPDLSALLDDLAGSIRGRINVALPAEVVSYNPALQTLTAKPTVSGRYQDPETGALVPFPIPAISNVPVAFPGAGLFSITWDLVPGDPVLLVFADRSLDEWKSTGLPETVPADVRRHDLTDAVAIPGLRPLTAPVPATGWASGALVLSAPDIRAGSALALSPVALAPLVDAVVQALTVYLAAHTHSGVTTGPGVSGPPVAPFVPAGSVAAVKLKAE